MQNMLLLFPVVDNSAKEYKSYHLLSDFSLLFFSPLTQTSLTYLWCRTHTIMISEKGQKGPQHGLENCIWQLTFITLPPEMEKNPHHS